MAAAEKTQTLADCRHEEDGLRDAKKAPIQPEAAVAILEASGNAPNPWGRGHLKLYLACGLIYYYILTNSN